MKNILLALWILVAMPLFGQTGMNQDNCATAPSTYVLSKSGCVAPVTSTGGLTDFGLAALPVYMTGTVDTPTTTPVLHLGFANFAAHEFFGNSSASSAAPGPVQPNFSDLAGTVSGAQLGSSLTALNNTKYITNYSGADGGAKVQACLNDLTAGQICDASALTGAQTISTAITIPDSVTLILNAQFSSSLLPTLNLGKSDTLIFLTPGTSGAELIYTGSASGSFVVCTAAKNCDGDKIYGLFLSHSSAVANDSSVGLNTNQVTNSSFYYPHVVGFDTNFSMSQASGASYYNHFYGPVSGPAYTYGYYFGQNFNQNQLYGPTCQSGAVATMTCFYFEHTAVANALYSPDVETSGAGLLQAYHLEGRSNGIYDPYQEGTFANVSDLGSLTEFSSVVGGIGASFHDNSPPWNLNVILAPGGATTASYSETPGGYPTYFQSKYIGMGGINNLVGPFSVGNYNSFLARLPVATLSRTSNVVTATLPGGFTISSSSVGAKVQILGSSPAGATTFDGDFFIASVPTSSTFTYAQTAADDTATEAWAMLIGSSPAATKLMISNGGTTAFQSISAGSGAPSGACTTGNIYLNSSGGPVTTLYVCASGAWVAK